jgi:uncharacterized protein involved in high-affinity Fe2+ transport
VERTMPTMLLVAPIAFTLTTLPVAAKEYYVGEPIVQNDMQIVPHYLLGIEMGASHWIRDAHV